MDESACLKKLTTYAAFTIRKVPPRHPKEGRGTWAEVVEERFAQEDSSSKLRSLIEDGAWPTRKNN
jgi:hypothetical protein